MKIWKYLTSERSERVRYFYCSLPFSITRGAQNGIYRPVMVHYGNMRLFWRFLYIMIALSSAEQCLNNLWWFGIEQVLQLRFNCNCLAFPSSTSRFDALSPSSPNCWKLLNLRLQFPLFQTSCAVVEEPNHFLWITGGWPGYNTL